MSNQDNIIHELTMLFLQKTIPNDTAIQPNDLAREYTRASKIIQETILNLDSLTDEEYVRESNRYW